MMQHRGQKISRYKIDDCGRLQTDMDMRSDPLESRLNKLSTKYLNGPIRVRMRPWRPSQVDVFLQSESSLQNVLELISFHLWAQSDVVACWRTWGTLGLGPQSTSLVLHAFHVCLALFFYPCMYFWKWQWTHIMAQHQFIKFTKYNHDKEWFQIWIKSV